MHNSFPLILVFALLSGFLLVMLALLGGQKRTLMQSRIRWFHKPASRPALYIICLRGRADVIKIGYTARKVETRMNEIAASVGPVRLLFSLRMPHAYAVEQACHRAMRRSRRFRHLRGEWYQGDARKARKLMLSKAAKIRWAAKLRQSWPRGASIFVWKDL